MSPLILAWLYRLCWQVDGGLARSVINAGARERLRVARPTFLGGLYCVAPYSALHCTAQVCLHSRPRQPWPSGIFATPPA